MMPRLSNSWWGSYIYLYKLIGWALEVKLDLKVEKAFELEGGMVFAEEVGLF